MKKIESMRELFTHELQDIYHAEKQLLNALPRMAKKASSEELKAALNDHCDETEGHVERLELCFEKMGEQAKAVECKAMKGIIAEAEETLTQEKAGPVLDAAIISCAQKAEHYEIASYGTVTEWAKTLIEEEKADELLSKLARKDINRGATAA